MSADTRLVVAIGLATAWMTGLLVAQGGGAPAPQAPASTPAAQAPAPQAPGAEAGPRGAGPAAGRQGGGGGARRGGFTQFTRPQAPQDIIARGKALYDTNCASCHAPDLRGSVTGIPNLLRSGVALRDQHGELIGAAVGRHSPVITLMEPDVVAVAGFIHSVHATMGGQGSPPGRNPTNVTLNVLVGDPSRGEETFLTRCGGCHAADRDLKAFGAKFSEPRELQNSWVSGSAEGGGGRGGGGGGRGGGAGAGLPAVVTLANGSTLEGTLVRQTEFLVVLTLPDGTRRSMPRVDGVPKVEVKDPRTGHVDAIVKMGHDDVDNSMMHDITAYLWTLK